MDFKTVLLYVKVLVNNFHLNGKRLEFNSKS